MNKYLTKLAGKLNRHAKHQVRTMTNIYRRAGKAFKSEKGSSRENKLIARLTRRNRR